MALKSSTVRGVLPERIDFDFFVFPSCFANASTHLFGL